MAGRARRRARLINATGERTLVPDLATLIAGLSREAIAPRAALTRSLRGTQSTERRDPPTESPPLHAQFAGPVVIDRSLDRRACAAAARAHLGFDRAKFVVMRRMTPIAPARERKLPLEKWRSRRKTIARC